MCSKCAREVAAKEGVQSDTIVKAPEGASPTLAISALKEGASMPVEPAVPAVVKAAGKKKKRKKTTSYKAMMKEIKGEKKTLEEERKAQKEKIQQSLGGGNFSKLEKI